MLVPHWLFEGLCKNSTSSPVSHWVRWVKSTFTHFRWCDEGLVALRQKKTQRQAETRVAHQHRSLVLRMQQSNKRRRRRRLGWWVSVCSGLYHTIIWWVSLETYGTVTLWYFGPKFQPVWDHIFDWQHFSQNCQHVSGDGSKSHTIKGYFENPHKCIFQVLFTSYLNSTVM